MINLGTDKIKDIYMGIDGISKIYLGTSLIWEKGTIMRTWARTTRDLSPYVNSIDISSRTGNMIIGKTIVSVQIGNFKEISKDYIKPMTNPEKISFTKSLDELTSNNDWIPQGTNITIQYIS